MTDPVEPWHDPNFGRLPPGATREPLSVERQAWLDEPGWRIVHARTERVTTPSGQPGVTFSFKIGRNGENMQLTTGKIMQKACEHLEKRYPHLHPEERATRDVIALTAGVAVDIQTRIEDQQQGHYRKISVPSVADALGASVEAGAEPDTLRYLISSAVLQGVLADMIVAIQEAEQDATFFGENAEDVARIYQFIHTKLDVALSQLIREARQAGKLREGQQ